MQKLDGSVVSGNTEEFLFTYSEEEKQQQEIDKANASHIFTPEFNPYRVSVKNAFDLSHVETLIYGFVRFYKSESSNRFYFTNEQIAEVIGCSVSVAEKGMATIISKGLIKVSYKIRAGGGKIRFVESVFIEGKFRLAENSNSDYLKSATLTSQNLQDNKNKINDNKIKERESETSLTLPIGNFNSIKTLTEETVSTIAQDYGVSIEFVKDVKENMELYCGSKGKRYKDYNLALRNWVKKDKAKKMFDFANLAKKRGGVVYGD